MAYADLKNDLVFRKVFGQHADVLMGLLNDLLERTGERAITALEYLPSDQAPVLPGLRLSILDVKCREVSGAVFVVEMQVLPVTGFLNRVVYNACKAYVGTLLKGHEYRTLVNVVAVSICDFELWSDAEQDASGVPRVPLVSHWRMAERTQGATGLGQIEYLFCELPKLGDRTPVTASDHWAALFAAAPLLSPDDVAHANLTMAQRAALELAREETFTAAEREAIERRHEEVDQVRRTVLAAEAKGRAEGRAEGELHAKRAMLWRLLARAGITLTDAQQARVERCRDVATLDGWVERALVARSAQDVFGNG